MQKSVSRSLQVAEQERVKRELLELGWFEEPNGNRYVKWKLACDGGVAMQYRSGKLVIQARELVLESISDVLDLSLGVKANGKANDEVNGGVINVEKDSKFIRDVEETSYIGCDEAGKGEFLGPLVLAACYVLPSMAKRLRDKGVIDSKKLTDDNVLELAEEIRAVTVWQIKVWEPFELSKEWQTVKNFSQLMVNGFTETIVKTLSDIVIMGDVFNGSCEYGKNIDYGNGQQEEKVRLKEVGNDCNNLDRIEWVVVDRFTSKTERLENALAKTEVNCKTSQGKENTKDGKNKISKKWNSRVAGKNSVLSFVKLKQIENGERCLNVAAASIIARAKYLQYMENLEKKYNRNFVRGYGKRLKTFCQKFIDDYGVKEFQLIAKSFFKTYKEVIR